MYYLKSILLFASLLLVAAHSYAQDERDSDVCIFEPGNISSDHIEYGSAIAPNGRELYFSRSDGQWGRGPVSSTIYVTYKRGGKWSAPVPASFSGTYDDSDPFITRDGNTLYFISDRPSETGRTSKDIWMVSRQVNGSWGIPIHLPDPINSDQTEYSPKTDGQGHLYFASDRAGGYGQGDLYIAGRQGGTFADPVNLGSQINSATGEWNLEVNAAGTLIIFEASQRPENKSPYGDLYITFKRDNTWSAPQNIIELNTTGSDLSPQLTRNERTLFFSSSDSLKSVSTNIYYTRFGPLLRTYRRQASYPN